MVTVDVVVTNPKAEFLLVKRNENNLIRKNAWGTPGGRVFRNEKLREAAMRVLQRETGLSVPSSSLRLRGAHEFLDAKEHTVTLIFSARNPTGTLARDETSSSLRWFARHNVPKSLLADYRDILSKAGIVVLKGARTWRGIR